MLRVATARRDKDKFARWAVVAATVTWLLANAFDVLSVLLYLRMGGMWPPVARRQPAAFLIIYAVMRGLLTMAALLGAVSASRNCPSIAQAAWGVLTICSLATVSISWWRLLA